jgi:flavin-dependent dehydrogenase
LNVGLGRVDRERLSEHVAEFCDFLRDRGKFDVTLPDRFHGHAYQLYERVVPKLVDDGVLLIGDAAGLAYPQSGEGIRPAVESGLLAAEVILSAANGDMSAYEARIHDRFGKPRTNSVTDWLPAAWLRFVAAKLLATQQFNRRVVLDRWFLHRDVSPLLDSSANRSSELQHK